MKADGKLHQDGYFTWSKRDTAYLMDGDDKRGYYVAGIGSIQ